MGYTVVVVDDDSVVLKAVRGILSENDMTAVTLNSGRALFEFMKVQTPDIILLDVVMPEMDGLETLRHLRVLEEELGKEKTPVIFLTADEKISVEAKALELGAMDFIKKPFVPSVLLLRIRHCVELVSLQRHLEQKVHKKTKDYKRLSLQIVRTLAETIDAKDAYTNGHSGRVADYSKEIAKRYGYSDDAQEQIYVMGLLHDVGKIGIPDAIINKEGRLTDEEYAIIKTHPVVGSKILSAIKDMPQLAIGARYHHERYDGTGYPDRLMGKDIPEAGRIIAVADAYDAMSSNRSYRNSLSQEKVRAEIEKGKGSQFDPVFADIMLQMIDEDTEYKMREVPGEEKR